MDLETQNNDTPQTIDTQRRNFAKAGLVTSGVILTLANRSALGAVTCTTPSGFSSINTSNHPHTCNGISPSLWANSTWPLYNDQKDSVTINTLFGCTHCGAENGQKVLDVLNKGDNNIDALYIAALFNSTMVLRDNTWNTPLTDEQVKTMYSQYLTNGGNITISTGVTWTPTEQIQYLRSTMGL